MQADAAHGEPTERSAATGGAPQQEPLPQTMPPTSTSTQTPRTSHDRRGHPAISTSWWWWEVGGAALLLVCMFTTIAVLAVLDNRPINDWHDNIQPAALLAVLSTIGKLGLTLVVGSCVSQLKWMHFLKPNHLSHLDVYDGVSRASPWDSTMMFLKTRTSLLRRGPDFMIALFAIVTLVAFAIDPFIQNILETQQHEIQLHNMNGSAKITSNLNYDSRAVDAREATDTQNNAHPNGNALLAQEVDFLKQLTSTAFQPDINCPSPGNRCEFQNITMLGLCSNFTNITNSTQRNCYQHSATVDGQSAHWVSCNYTLADETISRDLTINFGSSTDNHVYENFRSIVDNFQFDDENYLYKTPDAARLLTIRVVGNVTGPDFLETLPLVVPDTEVTLTHFYWCQQNYTKLSGNGSTASVSGSDEVTTAPLLYDDTDNSITTGIYKFTTVGEYDNFKSGDSNQIPQTSYSTNFYRSNFVTLFGLLDTKWPQFLTPNEPPAQLHPIVWAATNHQQVGAAETYVPDAIGTARFMVSANISELVQNIATAVTNQVQQSTQNQNADTTGGQLFANTAFYHVRWGWLALPLLEAVAAAILLFITILLNKLPVLKSSNIGLLAHGPEDAADTLRVSGVETAHRWEKFGDEMMVVLAKDERGWLRLIKT